MMRYFLAILLAFVAVFLILLGWLYSGSYNIAASDEHSDLVKWVFTTLLRNSVENHAEEVKTPDLTQASLDTGFRHFREMCVTCHGGPGEERSEIGRGLNPRPPALQEAAGEYDARELYWVVKHGIKMTGMPAFGETHRDEELWAIVKFVRQLPDISEEEYKQFEQRLTLTPEDGSSQAEHTHSH